MRRYNDRPFPEAEEMFSVAGVIMFGGCSYSSRPGCTSLLKGQTPDMYINRYHCAGPCPSPPPQKKYITGTPEQVWTCTPSLPLEVNQELWPAQCGVRAGGMHPTGMLLVSSICTNDFVKSNDLMSLRFILQVLRIVQTSKIKVSWLNISPSRGENRGHEEGCFPKSCSSPGWWLKRKLHQRFFLRVTGVREILIMTWVLDSPIQKEPVKFPRRTWPVLHFMCTSTLLKEIATSCQKPMA